ncbi:MAG: DUF859 family phage minor structural protein [Eubacteriales bacterium]|nr:DUF859 family phage minor structural protein [Eubacteriales bacterium]
MAWTYTQASHNSGWDDKNTHIVWMNHWSVTEQSPDAAHPGYIKLRVSVTTESYNVYPSSYVSPVSDTISYGGTSVAVHSGTLTPADHYYTYNQDVYIPLSWSGKTIELYICWTRVSVVCGAVGDFASTISASNGNFGSAIPISLTRKVSGTTHTVSVACGGRTQTLLTNSAATSATWTPALATYGPLFPSAMSGTATITCTTYFGSSSMSTTKSITVSFKADDVKPTVSSGWAAHAYNNSGTAAANIAAYVQGYSKAQVTFDTSKISCKYGASISSYKIVCGSVTDTASPFLTGTLTDTSATITCYVYDTRGQYASGTLSVTLNAYAKPTLSGISIYRSDSAGTQDEDSSCIAVQATQGISPINGLNSATLKVYTKEASASTYTDKGTLTSGARTVLSPYSADTTYDVKLEVTDALGNTATHIMRLPTRSWAMKFRPDGRGAAFGKAAETDKMLEVPSDWTIKIGNLAIKDGQSGTGYTKLPDGTLIQWGTLNWGHDVAANSTEVKGVGFPVAFVSTAYAVSVTVNNTSVPAKRVACVGTKATTWMNINTQENYGAAWTPYVDWVAVGRWK